MIFISYISRKLAERKSRLEKKRDKKNAIKKENKLIKEYGVMRLYSEDNRINVLLVYLKEVGVATSDDSDYYYFYVTFKDGTKLKCWNANKWECWMSIGEVDFSNGEKFRWDCRSPSYETLVAFKNLFNSCDYNSDYNRFLPLKVQRRLKLKKLKE